MQDPDSRLLELARQVASLLVSTNVRLVLAESCTAGLVAAALGRVPGISSWLCGSFVVYRETSKVAWLGVDERLLADPQITAVSNEVAVAMASGALAQTPEADLAVSITGHLGPGVAPDWDGRIHIGSAWRPRSDKAAERPRSSVTAARLTSPAPQDSDDISARQQRQTEAACRTLEVVVEQLYLTRSRLMSETGR